MIVGIVTSVSNMNGGYSIANPNAAEGNWSGEYSNLYPDIEYFDVYSPLISTVYGQVYWTVMDAVALPDDIVKRFDNKTMAILGYESDQVMKSEGGAPDVHVPITAAYNHHYGATLASKHATFVKRKVDANDPASTSGHPDADGYERVAIDVRGDAAPPNAGPPSVVMHEGNGGEYRKSFHGFPRGTAQLVSSPASFIMQPMQIDTWNREYDMHKGFVPGPEPVETLAPVGDRAKHIYSGLLECPCTDRIEKQYSFGGFTTKTAGTPAPQAAATAADPNGCFHAAKQLQLSQSIKITTASGINASMPRGCSITLVPGHAAKSNEATESAATVFYNMAPASTQTPSCGGGAGSTPPTLYGAALKNDIGGTVGMNIRAEPDAITVAIAGEADAWFGLGLNTSNMVGAYAIVVDGNGNVTERLLAYEGNGNKLLPPSVTVLSSSVENGRRVVWVRIPASSNNAHLSYNQLLQDGKLPIIVAAGNGAVFAYHKYKTAAQVTLAGVGVPSCIVSGGPSDVPFGKGKGTILYTPPAGEPGTPTSHVLGANTTNLGFNKDCLPYPKSVMLLQKNAECDIRTYTGGQSCCHHLFTLLDKNQTTPWQDKPL
eukprot:gene20806-29954_t